MVKETKNEILNRLFVENNLTDEDVFKHKFYTIITRSGIDKIQAINNINIKYELIYNSPDLKFVVIKAVATMGDKIIETYGECSPNNNQNSYGVAMAEKRAMSRSCLKLTGFYEHNVFGEEEADAFKKINNQ
tara:strand:- start:494 stop:889 length:396 start_codon:yes stop_codon:yes gene_type:complete